MNLKEKLQSPQLGVTSSRQLFQLTSHYKSKPEEEVDALKIIREMQTLNALFTTEVQAAVALWLANKISLSKEKGEEIALAGLLEKQQIDEKLEFSASVKNEISNLIASFAYFQTIVLKLRKIVKKIDIPFISEHASFLKIIWMFFVFAQSSLLKHIGNINETLSLLASVIVAFLERIDIHSFSFKKVENELLERIFNSCHLTNKEHFTKLLPKVNTYYSEFTKKKLLLQEWTSMEQFTIHFYKLEALYKKQITNQDIDMTYFIRKIQKENNPITPNAKKNKPEQPEKTDRLSPFGSPNMHDTVKVTPCSKIVLTPKTKKRSQQKIENNADSEISESDARMNREIKSIIDNPIENKKLIKYLNEVIKKVDHCLDSISSSFEIQMFENILFFIKESSKSNSNFSEKIINENFQLYFFCQSILLLIIHETKSTILVESVLKSLNLTPFFMLKFLEENSQITQIYPKSFQKGLLDLNKVLITSLVWRQIHLIELGNKLDPIIIKLAESRSTKLLATLQEELSLSREEFRVSIDICNYVLHSQHIFMNKRHLDQLALCSMYSACKFNKSKIKFKQILVAYKTLHPEIYEEVAYSSDVGDIISLYNAEFVPIVSAFMNQTKDSQVQECAPIVPCSPNSPSLKLPDRNLIPLDSRKALQFDS